MKELADFDSRLEGDVISKVESGNAYADQGNHEKALVCYSDAWDLLPEPKQNWEMLSSWVASCFYTSYFELGNFGAAVKWARIALDTRSSEVDTGPIINLGMAQYENGQTEEAWHNFHAAYLYGKIRAFEERPAKYLAYYLDRSNRLLKY